MNLSHPLRDLQSRVLVKSRRSRVTVLIALALAVSLVACGGEEKDLSPDAVPQPGKSDGFCPGVPARILPSSFPERQCLPPDPLALRIMDDVNAFWQSGVQVCRCGPDSPFCVNNAFSLFGTGYVYYDPNLLRHLVNSGSYLPTAWLLGHEFGHEIQGRYVSPATQLAQELGADCYAGYFLGSLVCQGRVVEFDLRQALQVACQGGDGDPLLWFDQDSHGTCQQRVEATLGGLQAYLSGESALWACTP